MNNRMISTVALSLMIAFAGVSTAAASQSSRSETAETIPAVEMLTQDEVREIHQQGTELGMTETSIAQAIDRLRRGELPDSLSGKAPKSVERFVDGYTIVTKQVFPDGSIRRSEVPDLLAIEQAALRGEVIPAYVSGCSYQGGSTWSVWTNCRVFEYAFPVTMGFRVSAYRDVGTPAHFTWYGSPTLGAIQASISFMSWTVYPGSQRIELAATVHGYVPGTPVNGTTTATTAAMITSSGAMSSQFWYG